MKEVLQILIEKARDVLIDTYRVALRRTNKDSVFIDAIIAEGKDKRITFKGTLVKGAVQADENAGVMVRKLCGENTLTTYGPQKDPKETPHLILIPTFSLLKTLGFRNFVKFIKDWPGQSTINLNNEEVVVARYSVIGQ